MGITAQELAERLGAELHGDPGAEISRIGNLAAAKKDELSFLSDSKYREDLANTGAGVVIIRKDDLEHCRTTALVMPDPYVEFAKAAQILDTTPLPAEGISDRAVISPSARLGKGVSVGPGTVIEDGAEIGDSVSIGANCFIGKHASIGSFTKLWSGVSIYHNVRIGSHCLFQSGAVIGSDGFGYANERGEWVKIPQLGSVTIGDRVEIGANTCVDRGAVDDTVIESNVIIDNLCQIAHNDHIGYGTAMAGATVVAGSVTIGKYCIIGGRSVFAGHITVADQVTIAGGTSVAASIRKPGTVWGSATVAHPEKKWRRNAVRFGELDDLFRRVAHLEKLAEEKK